MASIILETTEQGLTLDRGQLEELGVKPGRRVELVPLPTADNIINRALAQCVNRYGDALGVDEPRWNPSTEEWEINVYAPEGDRVLCQLYFDRRGTLIAERAPSREELLAIYHATCSQSQTA